MSDVVCQGPENAHYINMPVLEPYHKDSVKLKLFAHAQFVHPQIEMCFCWKSIGRSSQQLRSFEESWTSPLTENNKAVLNKPVTHILRPLTENRHLWDKYSTEK